MKLQIVLLSVFFASVLCLPVPDEAPEATKEIIETIAEAITESKTLPSETSATDAEKKVSIEAAEIIVEPVVSDTSDSKNSNGLEAAASAQAPDTVAIPKVVTDVDERQVEQKPSETSTTIEEKSETAATTSSPEAQNTEEKESESNVDVAAEGQQSQASEARKVIEPKSEPSTAVAESTEKPEIFIVVAESKSVNELEES